MSELKLYTMFCGFRGTITVVAENEAQARLLIEDEPNYDSGRALVEQEIKLGLIISDLGDM